MLKLSSHMSRNLRKKQHTRRGVTHMQFPSVNFEINPRWSLQRQAASRGLRGFSFQIIKLCQLCSAQPIGGELPFNNPIFQWRFRVFLSFLGFSMRTLWTSESLPQNEQSDLLNFGNLRFLCYLINVLSRAPFLFAKLVSFNVQNMYRQPKDVLNSEY